jgi:DNA mismatch repair ATPase MutS
VVEFTAGIQESAAALATVDVICSLSECARIYNYIRPHIREDETLVIKGGVILYLTR